MKQTHGFRRMPRIERGPDPCGERNFEHALGVILDPGVWVEAQARAGFQRRSSENHRRRSVIPSVLEDLSSPHDRPAPVAVMRDRVVDNRRIAIGTGFGDGPVPDRDLPQVTQQSGQLRRAVIGG